jgi:hypothetical protein
MVISSEIDHVAGELSAIVCKQVPWRTALSHQPIENLDDMFATKPLTDLDRQAIPAEDIG